MCTRQEGLNLAGSCAPGHGLRARAEQGTALRSPPDPAQLMQLVKAAMLAAHLLGVLVTALPWVMATSEAVKLLHNDSKKVQSAAQQETLAGMSSSDMEDWWSVSPEDLALLQADPNYHPQLKQKQGGALQAAVGLSDKTVDAWAGEITNKWRVLIAQRQKASGDAGQGADSLQSLRGKADHRGVAKEENLAPSATVGRQLWAQLKVVATAHLEAQAKQKAKQALEIADAVAQEERVALQQYQLSSPTSLCCCCLLQQRSIWSCVILCPSASQNTRDFEIVLSRRNGEFIFRSSNSVKPATDLPKDMMRRVRAATVGYCLRESHSSIRNAAAGLVPGEAGNRRSSRAGRPSDRHKPRQKYPTPWYVPSDMWGTSLESKLKQKVLARTGDTDPDYLKATELETLDWAQGAEQQAAQMFKKYIRKSGTRVPHYLRLVKTPDSNEQAMLNSHVNWSSKPISRSNTAKPSIEGMFSNPRDRLLGVYSTQDGNKDHMAVVAAAMQQGKVGKLESRQASTQATIRGILSGIK
ncbi:MAG: hypothetical protein FRX49_05618 [Trebouxia sp. A1-2]|nr:MAG: hypothetical protein FRX49_05618 [Trebouxia sp. A1-2]